MKLHASQINKIAIFRALQLGDMLCSIPAIKAIRFAYPFAEITLIGLPWAKSFTERFYKYFDNFILFPGYPGLPEQHLNPTAFTAFLNGVQTEQFDLVLQMQGNGSLVNPMVELFGAKYTAGFSKEGHYAPDNGLFVPYPECGHEIERHLKLIQFLGISSQGKHLEYPLTLEDYNALNKLGLKIESKKYVCIHPGSRGAWRQWPIEHFAAVADYCVEQGYQAVLTGTEDEAHIVSSVISKMRHKAINTAGKTSIGMVGALVKSAAMLISNCTGVSHIASAFETPSIVISMDGEPERWGPLDKRLHRTINWLELPDFDLVLHDTAKLLRQVN